MDSNHPIRYGQYLILSGLSAFLANKFVSGTLNYYINQRFFPLTVFAIILLWIMAVLVLLDILRSENGIGGRSLKTPRYWPIIFTSSLPMLSIVLKMKNIINIIAFVLGAVCSFVLIYFPAKRKNIISGNIPAYALVILALPVIIGVSAPAQPLSSQSLDTRAVNLTASFNSGQESSQSFSVIQDDRTILDWIKISSSANDPSTYFGQQANVIGFVYHDPRLAEDQFMLSRFVITCCVADAMAVGLPVESMDNMDIPDNTWVHVQGTLDKTSIDGDTVPLIQATSIEIIEAPEQPYLYP